LMGWSVQFAAVQPAKPLHLSLQCPDGMLHEMRRHEARQSALALRAQKTCMQPWTTCITLLPCSPGLRGRTQALVAEVAGFAQSSSEHTRLQGGPVRSSDCWLQRTRACPAPPPGLRPPARRAPPRPAPPRAPLPTPRRRLHRRPGLGAARRLVQAEQCDRSTAVLTLGGLHGRCCAQ